MLTTEQQDRIADRSDHGLAAIQAGTPDYEHNEQQTNLVDALANIMHYCRRAGLDFDTAMNQAERHVEAELDGEL